MLQLSVSWASKRDVKADYTTVIEVYEVSMKYRLANEDTVVARELLSDHSARRG